MLVLTMAHLEALCGGYESYGHGLHLRSRENKGVKHVKEYTL